MSSVETIVASVIVTIIVGTFYAICYAFEERRKRRLRNVAGCELLRKLIADRIIAVPERVSKEKIINSVLMEVVDKYELYDTTKKDVEKELESFRLTGGRRFHINEKTGMIIKLPD